MKYYVGIGSRQTPKEFLELFTKVAKYLFNKGYVLRSGGANGSDKAFELGTINKEIYLPWKGFNGNDSSLIVKDIKAFEIAKKYHPRWEYLSQGAKKLQARNSHQVLGWDLNTPSDFIICWTKNGKVRVDFKNKLKQADKKQFHKDKWLLQSNKEDLSEDNLMARDKILEQSETLTTAYWIKEMIRDMYKFTDKRQAYQWFYQIEKTIPDTKEFVEFRKLMKTYNACKDEIFNYFDARYTNAYTESVNNQIKKVEKQGARYSFEVLRGKCLFGLQQAKKPKFGSKSFRKVGIKFP